jgi:hypothetical protein
MITPPYGQGTGVGKKTGGPVGSPVWQSLGMYPYTGHEVPGKTMLNRQGEP